MARWTKVNSAKGSFGRGANAEDQCIADFIEHFREDCNRSTKQQDMEEHWDFECNGKLYDVKGIKFIDQDGISTYHYVEILNVRGNTGALFGKAHFMVFEDKDCWIVVGKTALIKMLIVMTNKEAKTKMPWTLYSREDREDLMVKVPTHNLRDIATLFVPKRSGNTDHQQ